ncbi:MAG TPA: D-aminoacylase [Polyangia bacterium]|nr:D-aminoacylase [Polyangia bacterium]
MTQGGLVLTGGTVIDGTGAPRFAADVRVESGVIVAVGQILPQPGDEIIDIRGRVLAPGFIDVHTHDDQIVLEAPAVLPKLTQGVTTVVIGNCGISLAPLVKSTVPPPLNLLGGTDKYRFATMAEYADAVDQARPAVNVAALVGHSTLRVNVLADPYLPASAAEVQRMAVLTEEAMAAGAFGLSTGVFYAPAAAADVAEVAALAKVAAASGGVYTTHIRTEQAEIMSALDEALTAAQLADVPVILSHHKCAGLANWGRSVETLAHIDAASKRQRVGLDAYPYVAGSTVLRTDLVDGVIEILVTWSETYPEMAGRWLADIARDWGCPQKEACDRLQPGGACYFQMDEEDVRRVLQYPGTMIGSDGLPHDAHPHPRLWGTFPRVLGVYARELGLFTLEEAVHKMTGLSASRFGLRGRGEIAAGNIADMVVFDAQRVVDRSTFEAPIQQAQGIDLVMVAGEIALRDGQPTGQRSGRFLRRPPPLPQDAAKRTA